MATVTVEVPDELSELIAQATACPNFRLKASTKIV